MRHTKAALLLLLTFLSSTALAASGPPGDGNPFPDDILMVTGSAPGALHLARTLEAAAGRVTRPDSQRSERAHL